MQIGNQNVQFQNDDGSPMSPEDIQKALQGGKLDTIIPGTSAFSPPTTVAPAGSAASTGGRAGGATPVAGETAKGPLPQSDVTATVPFPPGLLREAAIGGGQLIRGGMGVAALPGDFLAAGNELSRAATGQSYPQFLPTSRDIDALSSNLGITPPSLAPTGEAERLYASGMRGAGTALALGGAGALPEAAGPLARSFLTGTRPALSMPGTADLLRTAAPGVVGGVASQGTADLYQNFADPNNPLQPGLGVVGPPIAGAFFGGFTPRFGGAPPAAPIGTPSYQAFANRSGLIANRGLPATADVGADIQTGQGNLGMVRTSLSPNQWGKVLGPNVDPEDATDRVLSSPALTKKIVNDLPNVRDKLAGTAVANGYWPTLNPQTQEALIPNVDERAGVNNLHGAEAAPSAPPTPAAATETMVKRLVGSELGGSMAEYFSNLVTHDPKVQLAAHLLGFGMPFAGSVLGKFPFRPGAAGVGAGVGLGNTSQMLGPQPSQWPTPAL